MKEFACTCTGLASPCIGCQANAAVKEEHDRLTAIIRETAVKLNQMMLHKLVVVSDTLGNATLYIEQGEGKFFCMGVVSRREWERRTIELIQARRSGPIPTADPSQAVSPDNLETEAKIIGLLEKAVRGLEGIWPDWVYECRAAIKRRNEDTPWLNELLEALEWPEDQPLQAALNCVRRMVSVLKAQETEKNLVAGLDKELAKPPREGQSS